MCWTQECWRCWFRPGSKTYGDECSLWLLLQPGEETWTGQTHPLPAVGQFFLERYSTSRWSGRGLLQISTASVSWHENSAEPPSPATSCLPAKYVGWEARRIDTFYQEDWDFWGADLLRVPKGSLASSFLLLPCRRAVMEKKANDVPSLCGLQDLDRRRWPPGWGAVEQVIHGDQTYWVLGGSMLTSTVLFKLPQQLYLKSKNDYMLGFFCFHWNSWKVLSPVFFFRSMK